MDNKTALEFIERGLRGQIIDDLVAGWFFRVSEVSSNVYKVDGGDDQGHRVSRYGIDPKRVLELCIKDTQRIASRTKLFEQMHKLVADLFGTKRNTK